MTYTNDELNGMTVVQLKAILGDMGLTKTGVKADLVARILQGQILAKAKEEKQNVIHPDDRMANVLKEIRAKVGQMEEPPKEDLQKKTVPQLKEILKNIGLVPKGNKADLIKQIVDADKEADMQKKIEKQIKQISKNVSEEKEDKTINSLERLSKKISSGGAGPSEISAILNQISRRSIGVSARRSIGKRSMGVSARRSVEKRSMGVSARLTYPRKSIEKRSIGLSPMTSIEMTEGEKEWYYLDSDNNQKGPYTFDKLASMYIDEKINNETLIWSSSMGDDWKQLQNTRFKSILKKAIGKRSFESISVQADEIEKTIQKISSQNEMENEQTAKLEQQIQDLQKFINRARSNLKTTADFLDEKLLDEVTLVMNFANRMCDKEKIAKKNNDVCGDNRDKWRVVGNKLAQAVFRIREQLKEFE
jgi:Mg2+ and Co2+ transporter CorA